MKGVQIPSFGRWGRFPLFVAKIGTMSSSTIIVKRDRRFYKGQTIQFCKREELEGRRVGCAPKWQHGYVWQVDDGRLFIDL